MAEQAYLELTAKSHWVEQSKSWPGISDLRGIKGPFWAGDGLERIRGAQHTPGMLLPVPLCEV